MGLRLSGYASEQESVPDEPKEEPVNKRNEGPEAAAQPPLETHPALPLNLLRFSKLPVRINPGGGLYFQRPCPEDPPALEHPPAHLQGAKVGTCIHDGNDVFLGPFVVDRRVVAYRMWTKTRYLMDDDVRFDTPHDSLNYRMLKAELLFRGQTIWETMRASWYCRKIREWRRERRVWEMELLETEWENGNQEVFPPGTEDIDVVVAIMDLANQIEADDCAVLDSSSDEDEDDDEDGEEE